VPLVSRLPPVPIWRVVGSFTRRLRLPSTTAWLCGVVVRSLHRLFELDVGLSMGKNLAHLGDIVLQEMLVHGEQLATR